MLVVCSFDCLFGMLRMFVDLKDKSQDMEAT